MVSTQVQSVKRLNKHNSKLKILMLLDWVLHDENKLIDIHAEQDCREATTNLQKMIELLKCG